MVFKTWSEFGHENVGRYNRKRLCCVLLRQQNIPYSWLKCY